MFPADIAPITHDTVSVGALVYRVSVTALGALGVHPAAASGVVGGQEVVGQLVWGRGRGRGGRGRGWWFPIQLGNPRLNLLKSEGGAGGRVDHCLA